MSTTSRNLYNLTDCTRDREIPECTGESRRKYYAMAASDETYRDSIDLGPDHALPVLAGEYRVTNLAIRTVLIKMPNTVGSNLVVATTLNLASCYKAR